MAPFGFFGKRWRAGLPRLAAEAVTAHSQKSAGAHKE
jgi:hypothetical protein